MVDQQPPDNDGEEVPEDLRENLVQQLEYAKQPIDQIKKELARLKKLSNQTAERAAAATGRPMTTFVDEDEPFSFLSLGESLQKRILKKADYMSVTQLEETCREMQEKCKDLTPEVFIQEMYVLADQPWRMWTRWAEKPIHWYVDPAKTYPFRIYCRYIHLSEDEIINPENTKKVVEKLKKLKVKASLLGIYAEYSTEGLVKMIETLKLTGLSFQCAPARSSICDVDIIRNLRTFKAVRNTLTDEDLSRLKCPKIFVSHNPLTHRAANLLMKQWKRGEREIVFINIKRDTLRDSSSSAFRPSRFVSEIIDGLDANLVWSMPEDEVAGLQNGTMTSTTNEDTDMRYIYSVLRHTDIHNPLILYIEAACITIESDANEISALEYVPVLRRC